MENSREEGDHVSESERPEFAEEEMEEGRGNTMLSEYVRTI